MDLLSCTTQRDRDPIAEITVSWISLLQSFVRKDRAQGVDDLRKSCACGRGPHNRIEQREIVNRPQIPGCYHRNACSHQFMGISFALVVHDITSSRLASSRVSRPSSPSYSATRATRTFVAATHR